MNRYTKRPQAAFRDKTVHVLQSPGADHALLALMKLSAIPIDTSPDACTHFTIGVVANVKPTQSLLSPHHLSLPSAPSFAFEIPSQSSALAIACPVTSVEQAVSVNIFSSTTPQSDAVLVTRHAHFSQGRCSSYATLPPASYRADHVSWLVHDTPSTNAKLNVSSDADVAALN